MTLRCFALALCVAAPFRAIAVEPVATDPAVERRIDAMLARLTTEQKVDLIGGVDGTRRADHGNTWIPVHKGGGNIAIARCVSTRGK